MLTLTPLAGCYNSTPDQPAATETGAVPDTNVTDVTNTATPVAPTQSVTTNATEAAVRDAPLPPDEQTQDDADATGMTSRVNRGEAPANSSVP